MTTHDNSLVIPKIAYANLLKANVRTKEKYVVAKKVAKKASMFSQTSRYMN